MEGPNPQSCAKGIKVESGSLSQFSPRVTAIDGMRPEQKPEVACPCRGGTSLSDLLTQSMEWSTSRHMGLARRGGWEADQH